MTDILSKYLSNTFVKIIEYASIIFSGNAFKYFQFFGKILQKVNPEL